MNILEIIDKKRLKKELNKEELEYAINGYLGGTIKDYQMSSLLMAIVLNGMTDLETINLTNLMLNSGDTIDLSGIDGVVVDKHSTGGVGDKTTLVVGPIVAACDVKVAKMSGRGLGHTGGTIDKLESIKGFNVNLSNKDFIDQVNKVGISVVSQTGNLVPADKKIYALRDVTGTVSSIPLIASSIMSKKLASGASAIVLDVKVGNGALLKTLDDARKLARLMIKIGEAHNKKTVCVLSNMNEPLGKSIGNSLEVIEAIETLKGNGPDDLNELCLVLSSLMVSLGKDISYEAAKILVKEKFDKHEAYPIFEEFIKSQGGNINEINASDKIYSFKSPKTGWIKKIDALKLGELSGMLGAGRLTKDDVIDPSVGFVLNKKVGDYVLSDEELMKIYYNKKDIKMSDIYECFTITDELGQLEPLIYEIID